MVESKCYMDSLETQFSFCGDDLGDVREAVEHVQLFVAALQQLEVGGGDDL